MSAPKRVRKRDGREVPFDARKIGEAIFKAIRATGGEDRRLATELSEVVVLALSRRPVATSPHIEEIQDLVERVLMETGHGAVAKAYILYRDKRAQVRDALAVRKEGEARPGAAPAVHPPTGKALERWSKGKIVAALMIEADLPREVAETVASRVEDRVFASGLTRISTALVRELVDNELFSLGLGAKLRRQTLVGVPKYDLAQFLRTGFSSDDGVLRAPGGEAERTVAASVLGRFALEEVFPAAAVDRHLAGDLHLEGAASPHRFGGAGLLATAVAEGAFASLGTRPRPSTPLARVEDLGFLLGEALRAVSGAVALEDLEEFFGPLPEAERPPVARALLVTVGQVAAAARGEVALHVADPAEGFGRALLEAALGLPPPLPVFVLRRDAPWPAEGEGAPPAALAPRILLAWSSPEERFAARAVRRFGEEERMPVVLGTTAAVLNLPRLAYRAGRWNEGGILEEAFALLDAAVEAAVAARDFLAATAPVRGQALPPGRPAFALGVTGLVECVRYASGGEFDPRLARTLVGAIADGARAKGKERGISVFLELSPAGVSRARFERLDAQDYPASAEFVSPEGVRYGDGWTVPGPSPGAGAGLLASALPSGAVPYPDGRGGTPARFLEEFDRARREPDAVLSGRGPLRATGGP
ncbi:MAG TPA: ATP cone domain-containing protein [Planctomycetota bacterium]|nr:ATP cone domain-containing protein [Planctomycetota bacterium]